MGPTQEALALADFLIAKYSLGVDRYALAYSIMEHEEAAYVAMLAAAPAASGGEDGWSLAMRVREALDRASCPDHFMRIAVETITGDAPQPPAGASVSERARALLADAYRTIGYEQTAQKVLDGAWDQHPSMFALEQALTQQRGECEALWCLHVLGPDDVHPAPSKAHAEKAAERLNAFMASRKDRHPLDPVCRAVAALWPHSPESHAESVEQFITEWLTPATPQPGAEALRELVQWLREKAKRTDAEDRADDAYENCADKLESLLGRGA